MLFKKDISNGPTLLELDTLVQRMSHISFSFEVFKGYNNIFQYFCNALFNFLSSLSHLYYQSLLISFRYLHVFCVVFVMLCAAVDSRVLMFCILKMCLFS